MQSRKKAFVIRADADATIGAGHVMRCLALGQALKTQGCDVIFICVCNNEALYQRLSDEGFQVVTLAHPNPNPSDWQITSKVLQSLPAAWVVLDGYHFDSAYQHQIKACGHRLLVIDDMAHLDRYCCDILLNQNINAERLHYIAEPSPHYLLGPGYALLRTEFLSWMDSKRTIPKIASKVLVTLGGGNSDERMLKFIRAMQNVKVDELEAAIVIGPANPQVHALEAEADHSIFPIHLIDNARNMPELMAWADMAISAGGSTCWELSFMGLPTLVTILTENQRTIAEGLEEAEAAVNLGWYYNLSLMKITRKLKELATDADTRMQMSQRGRSLVDGKGVERVLREVMTKWSN